MDKSKPVVEVEVGPRFEVFYALHKLFAPSSATTERWRKSARARFGARLEREAVEIVPDPLMWAVLADATLSTHSIDSFDELIAALEKTNAGQFRTTILSGVPDVRGSVAKDHFRTLLRDPHDYRRRVIAVLRSFWERGFSEDFSTLKPELERAGRQIRAGGATAFSAALAKRLSLPIEIDEAAEMLIAGRSGYTAALARAGRIVLLPSAFNLNRWWTKRDDGEGPIDFFFPLNDGTVTPNDAVRESGGEAAPRAADIGLRGGASTSVRPEIVFRALGDTTRYAIATILARAPCTPTDLARQLRVSKPTITHHVHALRDAGLIVEGAEGGRLALDRSKLEALSFAAVSALFSTEGKLKLAKTRKR